MKVDLSICSNLSFLVLSQEGLSMLSVTVLFYPYLSDHPAGCSCIHRHLDDPKVAALSPK